MPMIDLTLPQGALEEDAKGRLVEELTAALLKWEGAPGNELAASVAWTYVDERPAGAINVAGRPAQEPRYRVRVTVPEGALDDERKARLVGHVAVAPLHERDQRRVEVQAHLREPVLVALGALLVALPLEDARAHETLQAIREDVARDPEIRLELVEAPHAQERLAEDQQ